MKVQRSTFKEERRVCGGRKQLEAGKRNPVAIAGRTHLYPSRTQKLSSPALMILGGRLPGKVGRCRFYKNRDCENAVSIFHVKRDSGRGVSPLDEPVLQMTKNKERNIDSKYFVFLYKDDL